MSRPQSDLPFVSVIVPCRNEERYIGKCLDSFLETDYPMDRLEVLVADGRSEDRTPRIIADYARRHPVIRLLDNPRRITPAALNTAVRAAKGDIIVRMDAHAVYPPTYISQLVAALRETGADSVGGVIVTLPADDKATSRAIAIGMSHPFGVGNSRFRIGTSVRRPVDHVPFFCCRKEVFDRVGMFDEELIRNQDGEFSSRLIRSGGRILLLPDVRSFYFARESLSKLARMFYQYGYFKPLSARKVGRVMTIRQLVPSSLLLTLLITGILSAWLPAAATAFFAILGTYAAAVLACSARAAREHPLAAAVMLSLVFPIMHFSYGFGFLRRVLELSSRTGARPGDTELIPLSR